MRCSYRVGRGAVGDAAKALLCQIAAGIREHEGSPEAGQQLTLVEPEAWVEVRSKTRHRAAVARALSRPRPRRSPRTTPPIEALPAARPLGAWEPLLWEELFSSAGG
jgi:hypothetical protein